MLASPVYFCSISAQLKAVIDRTVARWLEVKDKEFYYITTMADEEKASADTTLTCGGGLCCACGPGICNRTGTNRAFHAVFRAIRAVSLPKCGKICDT